MTLSSLTRCLVFAGVLSMIAATAEAQQPSGGRRTDLEYLDRGFDLEGDGVSYSKFPDTDKEQAKYQQEQVRRFQENLKKLTKLGQEDWLNTYEGASRGKSRSKLNKMAEDLAKVTAEMNEFLEWKLQLDPIEKTGTFTASVRERVAAVTPTVEKILKTIPVLTTGGITMDEFVEMRTNLEQLHLLGQSLQNSDK